MRREGVSTTAPSQDLQRQQEQREQEFPGSGLRPGEDGSDPHSSLSSKTAACVCTHMYMLASELESKRERAGDLSLAGSLDGPWRTAFLAPAEKESA